ncbi:hypothetical protein ABW19_dt0203587 [Dactylella cylindrospora]|nr:hypothetical protein ABW19_dt0203587 [Dactylella cylindrospora]
MDSSEPSIEATEPLTLEGSPRSPHVTRDSLERHLAEYTSTVHGDESIPLTPGEVQAFKDKGATDEDIRHLYSTSLVSDEKKTRIAVIQEMVLTELRSLIADLTEIKRTRDPRRRITKWVTILLPKSRFRPEAAHLSLVKRALAAVWSISPLWWIFAVLTGYYILRDFKEFLAIQAVSQSLRGILYDVKFLDKVQESDMRTLRGWRWNSVPWRDDMRE